MDFFILQSAVYVFKGRETKNGQAYVNKNTVFSSVICKYPFCLKGYVRFDFISYIANIETCQEAGV